METRDLGILYLGLGLDVGSTVTITLTLDEEKNGYVARDQLLYAL